MKQVYILYATPFTLNCDRIIAIYSSYEAAQKDFQSWMAAEEIELQQGREPQFEGMYILPFTVHDCAMGVKL